jgi:acetyl esterase/lipase
MHINGSLGVKGTGIDPFRRLMKIILSLLFYMSLFTSCQWNETHSATEKNIHAQTLLNVSYGQDSAQKMDIYLPEGRSMHSTKVMVLVHGGGWNGGNKTDFTTYIDSFKTRMPDYAIFNLNYRLVNGHHLFPAQENDIRLAMNFIAGHAGEYQVDTSRMVLLGASAGAHLALLQAYKYKDPQVKAVIDFFGPTDLISMYTHPWHPLVTYALQMVTGTTLKENPEVFRQSSPISFVDRNSPPTLIFHGGRDGIVNISQSRELQNKLKQQHVPNDLVIYPGEQHGWYGRNLHDSFDRIESFLNQHVP